MIPSVAIALTETALNHFACRNIEIKTRLKALNE